jgi:alkylation response protein AidB-like acyl-CoA dehydrogenase
MNLNLSEEQLMLQDSFLRLFQSESTSARIRAAEPLGFDPTLWTQVVAAGTPLIRIPEAAGGLGLGLFEAALIVETAGRSLASVPIIETIVSARLLSEIDSDGARDWLAKATSEGSLVTLALAAADNQPSQLVPAGAIANAVLFLQQDRLMLLPLDSSRSALANLGTQPIALIDLTASASGEARVLLEGEGAQRLHSLACEEWKLLAAATLVGMADQALEDAAAYSKERKAFDRPIGSYQGLAHPLADSVTEIHGARMLVWRAAGARSTTTRAAADISMAYWWAVRANAAAVIKAMRVFGGYGVSMEYDAQIFFRRSRSLAMLGGDPEAELQLLGDRLWTERADHAPSTPDASIDFGFGEAAEAYAETARAFFREHLNDELRSFAFATEDGNHPFNRQLASAGLLYADWPAEYGGEGRNPYEMAALQTVYTEFGWPKVLQTVTHMVGKIVMHFASDEAKREIMPRLATGGSHVALGYSEPSCGSDIFAAKTRAVRDGDDWIIDGQKMFTSQGHLADYCLLIARTDPDLPKHAGLTLFIVPLDVPGYECHEVKTLGAERTNITYYTAMRVPDRYRIGEINGGAKVLGSALALEQSGGDFFVGALQNVMKHALSWAHDPDANGRAPIEDGRVRARLAALQTRIDISDLLDRRSVWAFAEGATQKYYGPMAKLFASEALVACTTELAELTAPWSLLQGMSDLGAIELESRKAIQATIYGGTSEVQRSIIAESALAMPRTRS